MAEPPCSRLCKPKIQRLKKVIENISFDLKREKDQVELLHQRLRSQGDNRDRNGCCCPVSDCDSQTQWSAHSREHSAADSAQLSQITRQSGVQATDSRPTQSSTTQTKARTTVSRACNSDQPKLQQKEVEARFESCETNGRQVSHIEVQSASQLAIAYVQTQLEVGQAGVQAVRESQEQVSQSAHLQTAAVFTSTEGTILCVAQTQTAGRVCSALALDCQVVASQTKRAAYQTQTQQARGESSSQTHSCSIQCSTQFIPRRSACSQDEVAVLPTRQKTRECGVGGRVLLHLAAQNLPSSAVQPKCRQQSCSQTAKVSDLLLHLLSTQPASSRTVQSRPPGTRLQRLKLNYERERAERGCLLAKYTR